MQFGLIGQSLKHSFSRDYFTRKFEKLGLDHSYRNFELAHIDEFPKLVQEKPGLRGLNVTIPYKQQIIPFLSGLSPESEAIGAVNTVLIQKGEYRGFNTDAYGFEKSLIPLLQAHHSKALILGTGGASLAVAHVLQKLGISFVKVSRQPTSREVDYSKASQLTNQYFVIINATPLGTFPHVTQQPPLDMKGINGKHLCYDLIYNPAESQWLKEARQKGAITKNGLEMLELQAEKAWEIWNES